jgi:hypothetical protein
LPPKFTRARSRGQVGSIPLYAVALLPERIEAGAGWAIELAQPRTANCGVLSIRSFPREDEPGNPVGGGDLPSFMDRIAAV